MKNVRIISKKIITLFLIICMVSIYFPLLTLLSFATDSITSLDTPINLRWKDNSTATAIWNTVENANYYIVNVYLYNQNHELVDSKQTGTTSNELDLQQEIYSLMNERTINKFYIDYDVTALYINDNYTINSDISEKCVEIIIENAGKTKLATPTNVSLSDNYYASWTTTDSLSNIWFFGFDWKFEYNGNIKYVSGTGTSTAKNGTNVNVKNQIKSAYDKAGFSGETVKVSIRVKSWADYDTDYKDGDSSEYSNFIEYSSTGKIKLATPTNVSLSDNYYASWATTDSLSNIWFFGFDWKFEYNGNIKYVLGTGTSTAKNGTNVNVKNQIKSAYDKAGFSGETVKVSIRVKSWADYDTDYKNGDPSEYSNFVYYNPNGSTIISEIILSPNKPVVAVGRTLYIGKVIEPNNAYYSSIDWSTSDNSIVSINNMGQITGVKKGNATITAKINNATQDADVSVYEIESNINNTEQATAVINEANDVIEAITKNEDISNTDIIDKESVLNEVEQGAQNGDMFSVDIKYYEKSATEYNEIKDIMKSRYAEYNIAGGSDIKISISHTDNKDSEHHIANITELENEINVEFDIPNNIPELAKTKKRIYKLVRLHNENIEDVDFEISNGKIVTSSDKFSDFVLLYKDTELPTFNLSGTISSYDSETDDITIQLYKVNEIEVFKEKSVKGNNTNYSLENVPVGDYIVKLSKNNHVTREYTITLDNSSIDLDTKLCLFGDINNDGKVNGKDWIRLYEHINETNELTDYELLCGDVNKDGKVNGKDWIRLYEHINETNPLF